MVGPLGKFDLACTEKSPPLAKCAKRMRHSPFPRKIKTKIGRPEFRGLNRVTRFHAFLIRVAMTSTCSRTLALSGNNNECNDDFSPTMLAEWFYTTMIDSPNGIFSSWNISRDVCGTSTPQWSQFER
jgi:hypothetical protein